MEESPYFKIVSPHNVGHKVGPGLPTTFKLQFTPEEKKVSQMETSRSPIKYMKSFIEGFFRKENMI